jgi:hypothetical protein
VFARQVLDCLSHTSSPFGPGYFGGRVSLFAQVGLDCDSPLVTGMTGACYHTQLFPLRLGLMNFFFFSLLA